MTRQRALFQEAVAKIENSKTKRRKSGPNFVGRPKSLTETFDALKNSPPGPKQAANKLKLSLPELEEPPVMKRERSNSCLVVAHIHSPKRPVRH